MSEQEHGGTGWIFLGFLTGGLVGFGLGLLFAPSSGKETRQKIQSASHEAKERTVETVGKAKEKIEELVEEGRGKISEAVAEAKAEILSAVEAGKEAFQRRKAELLEGAKSEA